MADNFDKKGRGPSPTQQELEFLFTLMARGLSSREIVEEYQGSEFSPRQHRWVAEKQRYFDAARKILSENIKVEQNPLIVEARKVHQEELLKEATRVYDEVMIMSPMIQSRDLDVLHRAFELKDEWLAEEKSLPNRCLWEHLSGQQISNDYYEFLQKLNTLNKKCIEILEDIKRSTTTECATVLERLSAQFKCEHPQQLEGLGQELINVVYRWPDFVNTCRGLGESGTLDALIRRACEPLAIEGKNLVLGFYHDFHKSKLEKPEYSSLIEKQLLEYFHIPYKVHCVLAPKKTEAGLWEQLELMKPSNWLRYIHVKELIDTIYAHAMFGVRNRQSVEPNDNDYLIKKDTKYNTGTLSFGTAVLATLPLQVLEPIQHVHASLMKTYALSPEARQIHTLLTNLSDIASRMNEQFDILLARHYLPGECVVCKIMWPNT